jgi:hypothetical protein
MSENYDGGLLVADAKIEKGNNWQDTMTIPVAGDTTEFGFSLLDERPRQRVQNVLPLDEFRDYQQGGMSEQQDRLMELQRKDDLTDDEQAELLELVEEVNPEDEGRDSLGDDAVNALMDAGVHAIEPTEDDINDLLAADPEVQERVFGEIPDHVDHDTARDALKEYMEDRIENQPFPIKFQLGQRAFMETVSVMGNGFRET